MLSSKASSCSPSKAAALYKLLGLEDCPSPEQYSCDGACHQGTDAYTPGNSPQCLVVMHYCWQAVYTQLLRDRWLFGEASGAVERMDQHFNLPGRCLKERWGKYNREIAGLGAVWSEVWQESFGERREMIFLKYMKVMNNAGNKVFLYKGSNLPAETDFQWHFLTLRYSF